MSGLFVASNVSAIGASINLQRTQSLLTDTMTRLSTGLRINSGKDDPAGLISSELLKSDITATKQAIANTQRDNSMIAVADSALSQVSSILNDIRRLVNEGANTGAMSDDQVAANQLQIDASLDSIDRIAKTTTFQGIKLLDGSLDFSTSGVDFNQIADLRIDSANFGTSDSVAINIDVLEDADAARLIFNQGGIGDAVVLEIGGSRGNEIFQFEKGASVADIAESVNLRSDATGIRAIVGADATQGQLYVTSAGANNDINFTSKQAGSAAGNYSIKFTAGDDSGTRAVITEPLGDQAGIIEFQLQMEAWAAAKTKDLGVQNDGSIVKAVQFGAAATDLLAFYSDSGVNVKQVEFIQSSRPAVAGEKAAADLDSNGVLHIEFSSDATVANIATAVSAQIKGLNAVVNNGAAATAVDATKLGFQGTQDATYQNHAAVNTFKNTATWFLGGANAGTNGLSITVDKQLSEAATPTETVKGVLTKVDASVAAAAATYDAKSGMVTVTVNGTTHNLTAAAAAVNTLLSNTFGANFTATVAGAGATIVDGTLGGSVPGLTSTAGTAIAAVANTVTIAGNNALDITSRIPGSTANNTDVIYVLDTSLVSGGATPPVAFDYVTQPQRSSTSIMLGATTTKRDTLVFEAKAAGAALNDTLIKMESDSSLADGSVVVLWNAEKNEMHIRGDFGAAGTATYGTLQAEIEKVSPFKLAATDYTGKAITGSTTVGNALNGGLASATTLNAKTGQTAGTVGTDNGALIVRLGTTADGSVATANEVVNAFNRPENRPLAGMFSITNADGSNGTGRMMNIDPFLAGTAAAPVSGSNVYTFTGALTGGTNGWQTKVTANQLMDFVRNDSRLNELFEVGKLPTSTGEGLLTLFEEYAYYGSVEEENMLQFLGPKDSKSIEFLAGGSEFANQELQLVWSADTIGFTKAVLNSTNANASIVVEALTAGAEYDDMVVRFTRLDNNYTKADSYSTYTAGPSNSMAYCSINNDANSGTTAETGKFIVYSNQNNDRFNEVDIVAKIDDNQTEDVLTSYDEDLKRFTISLKNTGISLGEAMDAVNRSGIFTADFDYSNNANPNSDPGIETFANLFGSNTTSEFTIGNTGLTGGHVGGVLEVFLGGNDTEVTAQSAIDAINKSATTKGLFNSFNYAGSDGTGTIEFREDNLTDVEGSCNTVKTPKTVTVGGVFNAGTMQIYLATDKFGNSITTARDIVNYFDSLNAEDTHGVSVSLVRPAGVTNLPDNYCNDDYGNGIVDPNRVIGPCETDPESYALQFHTVGENIVPTKAYGDVIAVNGLDASIRIIAKQAGPEFEGIGIRYRSITDDSQTVGAQMDGDTITVFIRPDTTAAQVKTAIETSEQTKGLFDVQLLGSGNGTVTVFDDALRLSGGTFNAGYVGGAHLLGAADEDPHKLSFESIDLGSSQKVTVKTIQGNFKVMNEDGEFTDTDFGKDMKAALNGNTMTANGRNLHLSSSTLTLDTTLTGDVHAGDRVSFSITGGGAVFQLGPDVVSSQQIRIGIQSVNTARLGGASGRLYQLRDGEIASLKNDTKLADRIVQESISSIANTRGRLGALQRSTLEPNMAVLQDTVEQLSAAEADISNADFAVETSNLSRYQILMQSGAQVLSLAKQMPQYAAMLLG